METCPLLFLLFSCKTSETNNYKSAHYRIHFPGSYLNESHASVRHIWKKKLQQQPATASATLAIKMNFICMPNLSLSAFVHEWHGVTNGVLTSNVRIFDVFGKLFGKTLNLTWMFLIFTDETCFANVHFIIEVKEWRSKQISQNFTTNRLFAKWNYTFKFVWLRFNMNVSLAF